MRPFDPRLAREISVVRSQIGLTGALGFVSAALYAVAAVFTAEVIAEAFLFKADWSWLLPKVAVAAGAWAVRVAVQSHSDLTSRTAGLRVVAAARAKAVGSILRVGRAGANTGQVVGLLTRGIDGLEIYVSRYLPQLVISAIVPAGFIAVCAWLDPFAAVILLGTLPLVPLFMALVGWFTSDNVERHWQQVLGLSATLRDLLDGLPELKVFGRAREQSRAIAALGAQQQVAAMRVLRLSFLSALVLELLSTLSVAIVAVAIGLRLVNGEIELWRGLAVLIIAPEVYLPLRMLGVHFHAAAEGLDAWRQVTEILDRQPPVDGKLEIEGIVGVRWESVHITAGERLLNIPDGYARAGELVAIVGPTGCGKTSLLEALLGLRSTEDGLLAWQTMLGFESVQVISPDSLYKEVAYVGQAAWLGEGSVRQVLTLGLTHAPSDAEMRELLAKLKLPSSLEIQISDRGQGVSVGQRRRYAIARALLRRPNVLLLDEPAAALDFETERLVIDVVREFVKSGGSAIAVAHRAGFRLAADRVIDFSPRKALVY